MEHKKYNQVLFGIDIVKIIEERVREMAKTHWKTDSCPPKFWVSLNNEDDRNQSILLTISHNGFKFTETLFPRKKMVYGYDSILSHMVELYNRTM
jgi:hypothetical protein